MSSVASILEAPEPAASPAAQFTPLGRAAAAGTLVLGAALQLASFLTIPNHDETEERLRWIAANPSQADASKLLTSRVPVAPATKFDQYVSKSLPIGMMAPSPVTTALRAGSCSGGNAIPHGQTHPAIVGMDAASGRSQGQSPS